MSKYIVMAAVYIMAATVMAGTIVTAVLTMPGYSTTSIGIGALAGAIIALPVAWFVAGKIHGELSR